ncbi:hypothetical protein [Streptomyces flaveolus]
MSWLHGIRRLRLCWERRDDMHDVFLGSVVGVDPANGGLQPL